MTINDMLEQGVVVQGRVRVISVDDGGETTHFESLRVDWHGARAGEWADLDVNYLYVNPYGCLCIEVEEG